MTIWQIDDDPAHLLIAELMICRVHPSHQVKSFLSAAKALEAFQSAKPDMILLDLNMPDMNGWQFLETLGEGVGIPPIFIVSSSIDPRERKRGLEISLVRGFLEKPLRVADIQAYMSD